MKETRIEIVPRGMGICLPCAHGSGGVIEKTELVAIWILEEQGMKPDRVLVCRNHDNEWQKRKEKKEVPMPEQDPKAFTHGKPLESESKDSKKATRKKKK